MILYQSPLSTQCRFYDEQWGHSCYTLYYSIDTNVILDPMLEFNRGEWTLAIGVVYIVDSPAKNILVYSTQPFYLPSKDHTAAHIRSSSTSNLLYTPAQPLLYSIHKVYDQGTPRGQY